MQGVLSKVFSVKLDLVENNEDEEFVKLDTASLKIDRIRDKDGEISETDASSSEQQEEDEERDALLAAMLEQNLLNLFTQNIHNKIIPTKGGDNEVDVFFYLQPISSRLEHIFLVPSLTRDDVHQNESLRGAYQAIEHSFHDTGDMQLVSDMAEDLTRRVQHGGSKRSLIMDVSIDCLERFWVKQHESKEDNDENNDNSGVIIQGEECEEGEEKHVTHLVRFEMVTKKGRNRGERELGSWYIIDVDDMLNGNVWH